MTCKKKCSEKLDDTLRDKIFYDYWAMGNLDDRRRFISNNIKIEATKRKRGKGERAQEKTLNYSLTGINICKTMFLNTLSESEKTVRTALEKTESRPNLESDYRGKQGNRSFHENVILKVKEHIMSFPVMESHYVREGNQRKYLASTLDVSTMYRLYKESISPGEEHVGEQTYRNIFNYCTSLIWDSTSQRRTPVKWP